jgi:glycosyltransferase involved in cell wall biosynthesis
MLFLIEHLRGRLEEYIKRFDGKVKLYRTEKREGLVQARVIGAEKGTGDVIVVLDAHCECVTNWLPPLLTRIAVNRLVVLVAQLKKPLMSLFFSSLIQINCYIDIASFKYLHICFI